MMSLRIDVGVVVANMERSLGFYHGLIGLPIVAELTTSLIGKGRMVQLKHGESLIKLIEMDKTLTAKGPADIAGAVGYRYITLLVAEIEPIMATLKQHDVPISLPVTRLETGSTIAMVQDPDGNIVEFVQEGTRA